MAEAVGSLIILSTFNPQIDPASLVDCLWESLKYAGTVITAFFIGLDRNASAVYFILDNTIDDISSA